MHQRSSESVNISAQGTKEPTRASQASTWLQPTPWLTLGVVFITAIGAVLQATIPEFLPALRRDPSALAASQWWRVISPLVALDGNLWLHFAYDALGLLLVGIVVEQVMGRGRWLLLFFAAAITGTIAGYLWNPTGAGASIALCGLIGGLVIWQITRSDFHQIAAIYALALAAALTFEAIAAAFSASDMVVIIIAAVLCALLINMLLFVRRHSPTTPASAYFVGAVMLLCSLILTSLRDLHGVALLTGLIVAALLLWRKRAAAS